MWPTLSQKPTAEHFFRALSAEVAAHLRTPASRQRIPLLVKDRITDATGQVNDVERRLEIPAGATEDCMAIVKIVHKFHDEMVRWETAKSAIVWKCSPRDECRRPATRFVRTPGWYPAQPDRPGGGREVHMVIFNPGSTPICDNPACEGAAHQSTKMILKSVSDTIQQEQGGEGTPLYDKKTRVCDYCKAEQSEQKKPMKSCSQCKVAYYCDRECQRKAWKGHKEICKGARDAKSALSSVLPPSKRGAASDDDDD